MPPKVSIALGYKLFVIDFCEEVHVAGPEFLDGHGVRLEVDIEEGAGFRGVFNKDAAFFGEALVKRGAGEGRELGHLDVVNSALFDKVEDVSKALRAVAIHPEDEAAIHGDPMLLNGLDRA